MSTLLDRPATALVVIDVQNGVVVAAVRRDAVIAAIASLVDRARAGATPVVWIQHSSDDLAEGTNPWEIVPELTPLPDEPVVAKRYGDAFEETDLEQVLAARAVGHLVVTGAQTDQCVRSTLHGALVRGYDVTLVGDGHTTEDLTPYGAPPPEQVIAHTNLYWRYQEAPGRSCATVEAAEVSFSSARAAT